MFDPNDSTDLLKLPVSALHDEQQQRTVSQRSLADLTRL